MLSNNFVSIDLIENRPYLHLGLLIFSSVCRQILNYNYKNQYKNYFSKPRYVWYNYMLLLVNYKKKLSLVKKRHLNFSVFNERHRFDVSLIDIG